MQLPLPAFTDSLPTTLTWSQTGGVSVGGDVAYEFLPYEHDATVPITVGADTASLSENVYEPLIATAIGSATGILLETPVVLEHDAMVGLAIGADVATYFDGTVLLPVQIGAASAITFHEPAVYDIGVDDGLPRGGVALAGTATVAEVLPHAPTGGAVLAGRAVVLEAIPVVPSGGALIAGSAPVAVVTMPSVSGGAQLAGSAAVAVVVKPSASGGVQLAGAATVSDRSAWHMPSGGLALGGTALAYMLTADYPATTANPYAYPFPGWAINLENGAPSRYARLPTNSICHFNGVDYVANEGGIYAIDPIREGKPRRVSAVIGERGGADGDAAAQIHAVFEGASLANADSGGGVLIQSVAEGSRAAQSGLRPSDVILAVGRVPVANLDQLRAAVKNANAFAITIQRGRAKIVFPVG